jgi:tetratricopeptide (TPR) repeat protein
MTSAMSLLRTILVFWVATIWLSGCDRSAETETSAGTRDTTGAAKATSGGSQGITDRSEERRRDADAKLVDIKRRLAAAQRYTPEVVDSLRRLHREAPDDRSTIELLTTAYVKRQDWNALVDLLQSKPAADRSANEQIQLAKILVKAHRYDEAFKLSQPFAQQPGDAPNVDATWLAAYSAFHMGQLSQAAEILDANMERLIAAGRLDAYVVRALIHFRNGELPQAESLLTTVIEHQPSHAAAHDALGRVLVAAGDKERSTFHIGRASEIRDQLTRKEQKALRLSAMSQALKANWDSKDYAECDRLIAAMLPMANRKQQSQLYQYIAAMRAAQGREQEAREALATANQLLSVGEPSP